MRSQALRADFLMLITAMIWGPPSWPSASAWTISARFFSPVCASPRVPGAASSGDLPGRTAARHEPFLQRGLITGGLSMGLALTGDQSAAGRPAVHERDQLRLHYRPLCDRGAVAGARHRPKTGLGTWLGAFLAVAGMALLSIGEDFTVASGDWIQLAGAFVWGVHVLLVSFFVSRHDAIRLAFLQFATCAVVSLLLALIFEDINPASIWLAGPALIYGGLFAVAVGYTLQVVAQKHAIASHAAIILSLEAVFAAIAGALFLEESLTCVATWAAY